MARRRAILRNTSSPPPSTTSRSGPLRIVSIGGGNGLSTLLRGIKRYVNATEGGVEIAAVVTVTDDGGSSGRLRRDFDVLPPGDIRNCMVALSSDETLLSKLFQFRFTSGRGLKGHSFGNLFLTAMTDLTGDFHEAVKQSAEVLAVAGRILPSTRSNVSLEAVLANGQVLTGESRISRSTDPICRVNLRPRRVKPLEETLEAIAQADLITLGPGSLFTSVIPNLLVEGIPQAIARSHATKAYFMNLMGQPGETSGLRASDHLAALRSHAGRFSPNLIDVCVVNTQPFAQRSLSQYRARSAQPVEVDVDNLRAMGVRVIGTDLVRLAGRRPPRSAPAKIRHDPGATAAVAIELAHESRHSRSLR
jgi:uncharacterized cofD-like protein